jgi:hypothetical protein
MMNGQILKSPCTGGIIFGLVVAGFLAACRIPPAFAVCVGIIMGIVAFFVLNDTAESN